MFYVGSLGSDLTNPERGVQKVFFVRLSRGSDWRELMGVHGGGGGLLHQQAPSVRCNTSLKQINR